jgi:hypothetical protein
MNDVEKLTCSKRGALTRTVRRDPQLPGEPEGALDAYNQGKLVAFKLSEANGRAMV